MRTEVTSDWDDAYANSAHIAGSETLPALWAARSAGFRAQMGARYRDITWGAHPRQKLDLFLTDTPPRGLAVIVHGGYWVETDVSLWSFLATGLIAQGYAVALPSYRLAPEAGLPAIAKDVATGIAVAMDEINGPVRLLGHSAGGQLALRMATLHSPLGDSPIARIENIIPISGLFDLRPLRRTAMQDDLRITDAQVMSESPALSLPHPAFKGDVHLWVGGDERPVFLQQTQLMHLAWRGYLPLDMTVEAGRNHFSVLDGLSDPQSPLIHAIVT